MSWFLGISLALSSSSKLRGEKTGIGIGEVALLVLVLVVFYLAAKRRKSHSDFTAALFGRFWVVSVSCMILGLCCRMFILLDPKWNSVIHDSLALGLAIGFSTALTFLLNPYRNDFVEQMYIVVASIALFEGGLFLIGAFNQGLLPVPGGAPIPLWYENVVGVRFNGVCENPNQLALLLWGGPSVLTHAVLTTKRGWMMRIVYAFALAGCMTVGLATDSDALKVGWILQMSVYSIVELLKAFRSQRSMAYALVLVLMGTATIAYLNPGKVAAYAVQRAEKTYRDGDQGTTRIVLWREGASAVWQSPLVGYGPGSVLTTFWNQQEAHNNFIDWMLATGLVGSVAYFALLARILLRTMRGFSAFSGAMLLGVLASSSFGLSFRHPAYWFYIIVAAKVSTHAIWLQRKEARLTAERALRVRMIREMSEAFSRARDRASWAKAARGSRMEASDVSREGAGVIAT